MYALSCLILFLGCESGCDNQADIGITGIEITQAIQNVNHSVPLIAGRSTPVRAFLSTDTSTDIDLVGGLLTVTVDGVEITPAGGLRQISTGIASPNSSKDNETHTVNFELPAPSGITQSSNVDFEVTVEYFNDTNPGNNTFQMNNLTFITLENPKLLFVRVDYLPSGLGPPALSTVEAGVGEAMVKGIYPVLDSDPSLYEPATILATLPFDNDLNGNDSIDNDGVEASALLSTLDGIKNLGVVLGTGNLSYTFVYGWLNGDPMNGFAGIGPIGGTSAFGNTTLSRFQRSYAHELGHNFGMSHNDTTIILSQILSPDTGWDTGARLENNPSANNTTGRVKRSSFVDIMTSGPPTDSTWVNTNSYMQVFSRMLLETVLPFSVFPNDNQVAVPPARIPKSIKAPGAFLVQGYFNGDGTKLKLYPTLRLTHPSILRGIPNVGIFTAVVSTDKGRQVVPFDAMVCYEDDGPERHGYFELQIPMDPNEKIKSLEIYKTEGRQKMGELKSSPPSSIRLISPQQGSQLEEQVTVNWSVPAGANKESAYHLAYSPDDGENWVAVAANLKGKKHTFPSSLLPPTEKGKGILKLYTCEGLNTVTDQVHGLTR